MKKRANQKHSFLKQVIVLALSSCVVSVLILGVAQMLLSAAYFSRQAKDDLQFYLENTNLQFDAKIKNVEDMVISLSSNSVVERFLRGEPCDVELLKDQFNHIADLFSEGNMVGSSMPFISCIYLFNKEGQMVNTQFYPRTVEEQEKQNQLFKEINARFLAGSRQYQQLPAPDRSFLCARIYDENMNQTGSCVLSVERAAVETIFEGSDLYQEQLWRVSGAEGEILFENQQAKNNPELFAEQQALQEKASADSRYLLNEKKSGFGITASLMIDHHTVYRTSFSILLPYAVIFILVIGGAGTVVLVCAIRITRPIKWMGEDIRHFGSGKTDVRMREFDVLEFDEVSRLYNEMTGQIQTLIGRVYEEKLLATQMQLKYLQSQINPHFMFNILSMLSMRAGLNGDHEVQRLLSAFAKLVQGKIFRKGEAKIPLSEELELTRFYLLLQSERFGGQITYEIQCDEAVQQSRIPRLLVEPLVENAVSHGLEPKPDKGHVLVRAQQQNDLLCIVIQDNGIGFCPDELSEKNRMADEKHTHIGLENIRQTLQVLYGDKASMKIESEPGTGTCITMCLPLERTTDDVECNDCGR